MTLYRASPSDGIAWITGGSSGIGRALAKELASQGYTVAVTARDEDPIDALIAEAVPLKGQILSYPCDVADENRMAATIERIEKDAGPIALAVLCAGTYLPVAGDNMSVRKFRVSFDVNVMGVVHSLVPAVKAMSERERGQIVIVGSVSAYFGWPTTAAYASTKAALNVMAQALKFDLDKINIRIQVMNLGFIDTPLLRTHASSLPAVMSPASAARRLVKGIENGGFEVTFPRRLTWSLKLLALLPTPLCHWLVETMTGWKGRSSTFGRRFPRKS